MKRAAIYSRYSTDQQTESTLEDQRRVCSERARCLGYSVGARFEDAAISGGATGNRPGFLAMREAAERGDFDALFVMDMTRLSRNQGDLAKAVEWLVFNGIRVIGVHDGVDTDREGWETAVGVNGIIGEQFRKMIAKKTYEALSSRAAQGKPTGGRAYGYDCRNGTRAVNKEQAIVVRQIFERFVQGASCLAIARELNEAEPAVPSPGSTWNRTTRRCTGWAGSAVRVILRNPLYKGTVRWNASRWIKHPTTGALERRERLPSEWSEHDDSSLRIVRKELWNAAQARTKSRSNPAASLKRGGRARYLLSGLLRCGVCGRSYSAWGAMDYACGGHIDGRACTNSLRVKRKHAEDVILGPVFRELLDPERIERMAREMQGEYAALMAARDAHSEQVPQELRELDERIARLRKRLRDGDPDITEDELQAALDRAQVKRQVLAADSRPTKVSAKLLRVLPKAARLYREQIAAGLDGDRVEAERAREVLRNVVLLGGEIKLVPEGSTLFAEFSLQPPVMLVAAQVVHAGNHGLRTVGSGGRI